jgi:hypothetical protein
MPSFIGYSVVVGPQPDLVEIDAVANDGVELRQREDEEDSSPQLVDGVRIRYSPPSRLLLFLPEFCSRRRHPERDRSRMSE